MWLVNRGLDWYVVVVVVVVAVAVIEINDFGRNQKSMILAGIKIDDFGRNQNR